MLNNEKCKCVCRYVLNLKSTGAPIHDLGFRTGLKKSIFSCQRMNHEIAMLIFMKIEQNFGTWRQNWDFFGTIWALLSHLGPSSKFGTLLERLKVFAFHQLQLFHLYEFLPLENSCINVLAAIF